MTATFDIAVVGGGPAGATAGRLLALWGHSVVLFTNPPRSRPHLAECLPPSTRKVFEFLSIQQQIDDAGFFRTSGNTVWWGKDCRVEPYPAGWGYQVLRSAFDGLLLRLAQTAGVQVRFDKITNPDEIPAKFVLDCTGRAGLLGRNLRVREEAPKTVALCGEWHSESGWNCPEESHTLVETYEDGWAWSVPLSPRVRHVAFMVDPRRVDYRSELLKTAVFRELFESSILVREPWGQDATPYHSWNYASDGFLLVGDAGSFIDPLSSFGIKKAMVSAWAAAVVANTCLRKPALKAAAFSFFNDRERRVYASYRTHSATWFRSAAGEYQRPFWLKRAELFEMEDRPEIDVEASRRALDSIKGMPEIHLRLAEDVRLEERPGIEGREIVLRTVLIKNGDSTPWDFVASGDLAQLADLAPQSRQVPDLFDAYNRGGSPVPLPNFLTALAALLARGILKSREVQ